MMKKLFSLALTLVLLAGFTCAHAAQTRERVIMIEGCEETIVETLYESALGYQIWYPADLLQAYMQDGSDYFDSPDGSVGVAIVASNMSPEYVDEDMEALIELSVANGGEVLGEVEHWETELGVNVKHVDIIYDSTYNSAYTLYGTDWVFDVSCHYPQEAAEGFGTRIEQMLSTFEWE